MSGMPRRFYDLREFPQFSLINDSWELIRDEVRALDRPVLDIDRVNKSHEQVYAELQAHGSSGWLKGWNTDGLPNSKWLTYPIRMYDEMVFDIATAMPATYDLIRPLENIRVCALNRMLPDLFLGTHDHPDHKRRGTLLYHICLDMEEAPTPFNYLNVNGEFLQQLPGKAYVFDGSLPHFALNASSRERTILYMEFYAR